MITKYYTPTKVIFGEGAEEKAGELLEENGARRVLVHYGSDRIKASGLLDMVLGTLREHGLGFVTLGGVLSNPRLSLIKEGIELGKKENVDFILAVGGGSVIDSAKAIGYGIYNGGDVWDFYSGLRKPEGIVPIGALLTHSAAGSEMSDSSVVTNEDGWLKRGFSSDISRPVFALLNPALTYSVPPYTTSCGTTDIMMHTLERFFHPGFTLPLTDALSIAELKAVMKAGRDVLSDGSDYESRATLMWASSVSHNGLMQMGNDQRGDWACHQIEHEVSGMYDVAHGAGLAAIWGSWARYVYHENPDRFASLGEGLFGIKRDGSSSLEAEKTISAMEEFFTSIHMPTNLKDLGVNPTESEIDEMAVKCTFFGKRTIGSFKVLKEEDIKAILVSALK